MKKGFLIFGGVVVVGFTVWYLNEKRKQNVIGKFNKDCIARGRDVLRSGEVCGTRK